MGIINEDISSKDITFQKLEKMINYILSQEKTKFKNINTLKEIGLANQYTSLINFKNSKEIKYISKKHKTLKNYITLQKSKSYFIKWTNLLFNIKEEDYNSFPYYNKKIQNLRNGLLTKAFLQKNVKKNLFENISNIKIFKYGIPNYLREFIWEIIIAEKYASQKYFDRYAEEKEYNLFIRNINKKIINSQIEKDVSRTFSDISDSSDNKIHILKNLLIYASSLTKDGYCQGMNFIIGFILKSTNFDEIKAFYFIKYIFPEIKGYFEQGFHLLKKNINIFYKLFSKLYPRLDSHFRKNDVFAQFWVGKWFQNLFTISLPFDELCYIWDLLLIKGFDFSIYLCLSIIDCLEKYLIDLNDSSDILSHLKNSLNPEEKYSININDINDKNKYIIPLKKIFLKSLYLEKKIKNDKIFREIINSKNEDCESNCSKNTKETETSNVNILYFNNSSAQSTLSSKSILSVNNTLRSYILSDKKKINNNIKTNQFNANHLKFNISNSKLNIYNNLSNINNNFCLNQENKKVFHLFENVDLLQRKFNDLNINNNNYIFANFGIYYVFNIPNPRLNYVNWNNTLLLYTKASYNDFGVYSTI